MSTQSEKTGSEELSEKDYERAKEMLEQFIKEESSRRSYTEVYVSAVSFLTGLFKSKGNVPVSLLEYARKVSTEETIARWIK